MSPSAASRCFVLLRLNTAACLLKLSEALPDVSMSAGHAPHEARKEAEALCTAVLAEAPTHAKALYRRAVARRHLCELDGALTDAKAAVEAEPQSADVRAELAAVREALAAQKEEEKELARKMLGQAPKAPEPTM